jgi:hypothetical protein
MKPHHTYLKPIALILAEQERHERERQRADELCAAIMESLSPPPGGVSAADAALIAEAEAIAARQRKDRKLAWAKGILSAQAQPSDDGQRKPIPKEIRYAVFTRDGGRCVECGSNFELQFDHVIPLSMGGSSTIENLQVLCADCNLRKGASLG